MKNMIEGPYRPAKIQKNPGWKETLVWLITVGPPALFFSIWLIWHRENDQFLQYCSALASCFALLAAAYAAGKLQRKNNSMKCIIPMLIYAFIELGMPEQASAVPPYYLVSGNTNTASMVKVDQNTRTLLTETTISNSKDWRRLSQEEVIALGFAKDTVAYSPIAPSCNLVIAILVIVVGIVIIYIIYKLCKMIPDPKESSLNNRVISQASDQELEQILPSGSLAIIVNANDMTNSVSGTIQSCTNIASNVWTSEFKMITPNLMTGGNIEVRNADGSKVINTIPVPTDLIYSGTNQLFFATNSPAFTDNSSAHQKFYRFVPDTVNQ